MNTIVIYCQATLEVTGVESVLVVCTKYLSKFSLSKHPPRTTQLQLTQSSCHH
jgi:hypothetical protein